MQRSRRTSPARTTKRDAHDDGSEEALRAPEHSFGMSEDKLGNVSDTYVPLSLRTGAGQYRDEVFRLLVKIRAECDAAAQRLGYASARDDGLAAVEYIANKILVAVRGERQQQKTSIKREPQAKSRPSRSKETPAEVTYKSEKVSQRASYSERSKLIDELKQMLRDKKTKSGAFIDSQLAHEIAKHITILNEAAAQPETKKSIRQFQENTAPFFAKLYGARKKLSKQNVTSKAARLKA